MTEAEYNEFASSPEYQEWLRLHQRAAKGETLTEAERTTYEAFRQRLDDRERAMLDESYLASAREMRKGIAKSDAEIERLRARRDALTARIRELECNLNESTRRALGIETEAAWG